MSANDHIYGDGLGLLRAFLADDIEGAARLISNLDTREVLLVLGGLVQLGAGFVHDLATLTGRTTDELLDELRDDLQRRSA